MVNQKRKFILVSTLTVIFMLLSTLSVLAAVDTGADIGQEELIAAILGTSPEDAGEPITVPPENSGTDYAQDISFPESTLHGIFSSTELFFFVQEYWQDEYIYAEIQYNVSDLIQGAVSSMTFSVNNTPVQSCQVSYSDGNTQVAYVEIPINLLKKGYNSFSISAYARLFDEEGCIDDFSGANWLNIASSSYIRCGYNIKSADHKISYYPYPFMSTTDETGTGLTIAVSDQASNGEVAAAMNLMADLSTETGTDNHIQFCLLSDIPSTNPNRTIVVANYNNLSDAYKQKITDTSNLSEYADVLFLDDDQGNPLLLITSNDDSCLLEAAYMLMDDDRVTQETSSKAAVKSGSSEIVVNSKALSQMVAGNYKLEDIIGSGLTFVGPFHQEQNVYLPFSEDYFLSDAGKITLNFRYSENLDFDRSVITVFWGDVPIASKKLEKDKAMGDELTFAMPSDVVGTTAGSIKIAFDLEIRDLICTPRQDQMPWAYVSSESTLYLPAAMKNVLTFDLKPSPFRTDGKFNDLLVVIPDAPSSEDLNLYAQIIGMYGDGVDPYGTFYVKHSSEFNRNDADYNIITAGTYADNEVIKSINDQLYFAYDDSGTRYLSNEQLILSDDYAKKIAILQLMESPFKENRGVLAVTGANDSALANVIRLLRNAEKRLSLSKDCVIVDEDLKIKTYQFINKAENMDEPSMMGTLSEHKQTLLFTIVSTAGMAMILIATIIVLLRIRSYNKKDED